jgi:hypothetical protein
MDRGGAFGRNSDRWRKAGRFPASAVQQGQGALFARRPLLAMISGEAGQPDVYVTAYPGPGEKIRVSTGGAGSLRWSRDGEILFLSGDNRVMAVPIQTTPPLKIRPPAELFTLKEKSAWLDFDVSPDGKRFLAVVPEVVADELPLEVIVNWTAALEKQR